MDVVLKYKGKSIATGSFGWNNKCIPPRPHDDTIWAKFTKQQVKSVIDLTKYGHDVWSSIAVY